MAGVSELHALTVINPLEERNSLHAQLATSPRHAKFGHLTKSSFSVLLDLTPCILYLGILPRHLSPSRDVFSQHVVGRDIHWTRNFSMLHLVMLHSDQSACYWSILLDEIFILHARFSMLCLVT